MTYFNLNTNETTNIEEPTLLSAVFGTPAIAEESIDPASRAEGLLALHHSMNNGINFDATKELALQCIDAILEHWLPDGEQRGKQYLAYNPNRNDASLGSFTINMETSMWSEFATDNRGGDLISLIAYAEGGISQSSAAVKILEFIAGHQVDVAVHQAKQEAKAKAKVQDEFTVIMPIPGDARTKPVFFGEELGTPSITWTYRNEIGQPMFYVNRFELASSKTTRPLIYCKDSSGHTTWKLKAPPVPRPAYGLDRLAARPDAPVLFTEGEKAADAAQRLLPDFVAVTTMNGAQSPDKTDFGPFAGRKVYIAPDNDEAGEAYRDKLIGLLSAAGAEVVGVLNSDMFVQADGTLAKGYDLADAEAEGWTAERMAGIGDGLWPPVPNAVPSSESVATGPALPGLKSTEIDQTEEEYEVGEYQVRKAGLFRPIRDRDGKIINHVRFCSRIDVIAYTRNHESHSWGKELRFKDPDGQIKTWVLAAEHLSGSGDSYRAILLGMGVAITPGPANALALTSYLSAATPNAKRLSVNQPGWFKSVFVLPDAAYGLANEQVVFQGKTLEDARRFAPKGSLESWQQNVAVPCIGNSRAALSICVGLAAPLLALLGEDNGGFHLRGNSSSGKTVCLAIGSSVWGGSDLIRTWNMTVNGLEGVAAMHNDVLLPMDELGQASPITASESAYMLGNGQGKSRADKTGAGKAVKRFRTLVLSSGERGLVDMMAQIGQSAMAGQEVRMVDISADAGAGYGVFENIHGAQTSQIFAEALKLAVTEHHGHAGRAFVEVLANAELRPNLIAKIRASIKDFLDCFVPSGATGQVGRVGRRFGLVAAAGEACIELGILPWPAGEAIDAARKCFGAWIDQRGGIGNQEEEKTIAQVRNFIELHGESRFTLLSPSSDGCVDIKTNLRAGYRQHSDDGRIEYFIFPNVYKSEICKGLNSTAATKILIGRGLLATTSDGKAQIEKRVPNLGKIRMYRLTPDILGEGVSQVEKEETEGRHSSTSKLAMKYSI